MLDIKKSQIVIASYHVNFQCCGAGPTLTRLRHRLRLPAPDNNIFGTQI